MRHFVHTWCTPTGLLALFAFLLPWQTRYIFGWSYLSGDPTQFGTLSVYVTQVLLVAGLLLVYAWRGFPKFEHIDSRLFVIGGLFFLANIVSAWLAKSSVPALAGFLDLSLAMIFFWAMLDSRVDYRKIMFAFALGLCIPVMLGVGQVLTGGNEPSTILGLAARDAQRAGDAVMMLNDGTRVLRAYGPFPHPNAFGGYLAIGLLSILALRSGQGRVTAELPELSTSLNPPLRLMAIVLGIGLVLTASRSAIFGLILGFGIASCVARGADRRRLVAPLAAAAVCLALIVTYAAPSVVTSLRGGGALEARSVTERVQQYHDWFSTMHGADWLIGNGPRNYVFALADVHPQQSVWDYQPIHNVPLLILSELGVVGILLIFIGLIFVLRKSTSPYATGMAAVLFFIMFFDHYLWSSWSGLALVGYVYALNLRLKPLQKATTAA